jgi:hypothetical protein
LSLLLTLDMRLGRRVKKKISPTTRILRGVAGEYYIVREVAEKTGISESLIRKSIRNGVKEMMPSKTTANGKIYLFTPEDIERMIKYDKEQNAPKDFDHSTQRFGRPRKYSDEKRVERSRLHSQANYWKRRMKDAKTEEQRKQASDKYEETRKKLDE